MPRKLVVSANCRTGGIAAALQFMFPEDEVKPIPLPPVEDEEGVKVLVAELGGAWAWVAQGRFELASSMGVQIVKVPATHFEGFHPDLTYARKGSTDQLTLPQHYNSQIGIWAFNNRVEPSDAARIFNGATYASLGYFERWSKSVETMKGDWLRCGFSEQEFNTYFCRVKRRSVFMYSVNHPRAEAVVELCKALALKLGTDRKVMDREIVIPDALTYTIWPVYPEIGEELGFSGDYIWRFGNREYNGVTTYLTHAYECYARQEIAPGDLVPATQLLNIDETLSRRMGSYE